MFLKHILSTVLVGTSLLSASAQTSEDYVVTVRNDTLYGEVKSNSILEYNESVTLRPRDQKKKTVFTPNTAKAFRSKDKIYHSVLLRDHYVFMQLLADGYLKVYEQEVMTRQSNMLEINDYIKINMGELTLIPKISFRKKIAPLLEDCPSVHQKVEDKTYDFTDLIAIAKEYNLCIATQPHAQPQPAAMAAPEAPAKPGNAEIGELLTYLEQNPQTENREDLVSCLNDINSKVKAGATVPKYLLSALVNLTQSTEAIKTKALKVATDLGYQVAK